MGVQGDKANMEKTYDIIIIGAGTAGSVLVNRLSENPDVSILVLEAGEDRNNDPNVYTPGLCLNLLDNDDYDWRFTTEPESGLNNRVLKHPRGKIVGGSSAINSFALIYPNRAGVDVWEEMGSDGWGWNDMQASFKAFQKINEPSVGVREELALAHGAETARGTDGPLQASFPPRVMPLQKAWVDAWESLGVNHNSDALDGEALGGHTSTCHISATRKERSHAGVAFLEPTKDRKNVTIITGALVEKIIFSTGQNGKQTATDVQYKQSHSTHIIHAEREIVLSAGTFASSALLELSGIGDSRRLSELNIPVIYHNRNVGENLQDHIRGGMSFEAADHVPKRGLVPADEAQRQYEKDRSGPWGESVCWAFSYMPLLPIMSEDEQAEFLSLLEKSFAEERPSSKFEEQRNKFIQTMLSSNHEAVATAYLARKPAIPAPTAGSSTAPAAGADTQPTEWISVFAMLGHPMSRGSVHITSFSPAQKPKIVCNYYDHPLDIEVHARVLKALEKLAAAPPLSQYIKVGGKREPALGSNSTLEAYKESLRKYAGTNYHPTGTCSMLPEEVGGVVDSRLRVYGTNNLRVVDASVMPMITRGNIITAVYAIAEKAAEILKKDLGI